MSTLRFAMAVLLLSAVALIVVPARAADKKKDDPKAAEVEKLLLAVPNDVTQGEWIKAWREKLLVTFSEEITVGGNDVVRFTLENKTPCTIKISNDLSSLNWASRLVGLTADGRPAPKKPAAKEKDAKPAPETWTVEPGKKLVISKKPVVSRRVMEVPLKNDLDKKALISVLYSGPLCAIQLVPTDKDAMPLDLMVLTRVGANGLKVAVSGYYLCKSADAKDVMEKVSKFN